MVLVLIYQSEIRMTELIQASYESMLWWNIVWKFSYAFFLSSLSLKLCQNYQIGTFVFPKLGY